MNIKTEMIVNNQKIGVLIINDREYISLTDLAKFKNRLTPGDVIIKRMSNKNSYDFYCLWEELNNKNFKLAESREFKLEASNHAFVMSPSRWITLTNAICSLD